MTTRLPDTDTEVCRTVTVGFVFEKGGGWLLGYDPSTGGTRLLEKLNPEEAERWRRRERAKIDRENMKYAI